MEQAAAHEKIQALLEKTENKLTEEMDAYRKKPFVQVDPLLEQIGSVFTKMGEDLDQARDGYLGLLDTDGIRDAIEALFHQRLGPEYTADRLEEIYDDGASRFKREIPPGFRDREKPIPGRYGDLVLWYQVIDYAKQTQKPVILISDDRKDDWWLRVKGRIIGPRPELVEEMLSKAGVLFYMYQTGPFMEHAGDYLKKRISQAALEEVRELRRRDEEEMTAARLAELQPYVSSPLLGSAVVTPSQLEEILTGTATSSGLASHGLTPEEFQAFLESGVPGTRFPQGIGWSGSAVDEYFKGGRLAPPSTLTRDGLARMRRLVDHLETEVPSVDEVEAPGRTERQPDEPDDDEGSDDGGEGQESDH